MSKVRFYIAMAAAKTAHRLLRLCGRAATHTPGAVATKLCPDFLRYLQKPETLICVTGTDGKTTVSNLLATVLQNNGYTVTNNSYGSNICEGVVSALLTDATFSGKPKKQVGVLEVDERSSLKVYKYLTPDILICNNIMRDSLKRNAHTEFICYILNKQQIFEVVPTEAEVIRTIFKLYLDGWGYKKIANYLTDNNVPTPRMSECERRAAAGEPVRRKTKAAWAIVTVQGILDNDFYIGTLRQGKFTRVKINGSDRKLDEREHRVFEHHHQEIIDYRTFATVRALRESRSTNNYRGVKVNDNVYSGLLVCGDCGSPMFAMSRSDLAPAYTCGTYHRRGLKGCTSHHIRVETLDALVKDYVRKVRDNSSSMLERLNADLEKEQADIAETKRTEENLEALLLEKQEELKATKRQRIRDIMKHPEQEKLLEETYDELEAELTQRIAGIQHQIEFASDKRNTIIRINRVAKTAIDVFNDILEKPALDRNDLNLMIEKIRVYEDHIEVQLKADIDSLLKTGALPEDTGNFKSDTESNELHLVGTDAASRPRVDVGIDPYEIESAHSGIDPYETEIVQRAKNHEDKVFRVSVISSGDPLEIYTEKDGEVIFKKYSPMGDLTDFAAQICESIGKNTATSPPFPTGTLSLRPTACSGASSWTSTARRSSSSLWRPEKSIAISRGRQKFTPPTRRSGTILV